MRFHVIAFSLVIVFFGCKVKQNSAPSQDIVTEVEDTVRNLEVIDQPPLEYHVYRASRTRLMDIIHTKLEISLDWEKQRLNGLATLQLRPYFNPQDKVILDAKNFDIHHIKLIKGTDKQDLFYFYDGLQILISLDTV